MADASSSPLVPRRAIFVSYSHDDAIAARRIAEALRAAGLEVWFDENELRGGDSWDAKIKTQIRDCALFLPVISQNTQRRREGYFRLEWHLAEERSRLIARGTPFLVPVVIDEVGERGALVPEVFLSVQWTRLRDGEATGAFGERVKQLLAGDSQMEPGRPRPGERGEGAASPGKPAKVGGRVPAAVWIGYAAACAIAVATFFALRPAQNAGAGTRSPSPEKTAAIAASVPAAPRLGPKSIAVLPFDNLSEDKDANAAFADGMHDDVISNLLLIRELRPTPRATAMTYRGTKKTPREIADELGVAYLLNGTVRRAGNQVRITAALLNPSADETVWNKLYAKDLTHLFTIQSELAQAIASELKAVIAPEARKLLERPPTTDATAYDSFLKARDLRHRGPRTGAGGARATLEMIEALLQASVALDPKFALAWADLARVHCVAYQGQYNSWRDRSPARREKARLAIEAALRLGPDEPEVVLSLGYYRQCWDRDYDRAAIEFQRAERLLPHSPEPLAALAQLRRSQGHWGEALAYSRRAAALDPLDSTTNTDLLVILAAGRRSDEADIELRRLVLSFPNQAFTLARLPFNARGETRAVEEFLVLVATRSPIAASSADPIRKFFFQWRFAHQHEKFLPPLDEFNQLPILDVSTSETWEWEIHLAVINTAQGRGDLARRRIANGPANLRARLKLDPLNVTLLCDLACIEALLGHREEALQAVRAAMEISPTEFDRWIGPQIEENLAFVQAWTGDKDAAISTYARLLQTPMVSPRLAGINVHTMRHSLWFSPLRGDPRFEALLNDPKNNAPLF